jgi:hypothetical protein
LFVNAVIIFCGFELEYSLLDPVRREVHVFSPTKHGLNICSLFSNKQYMICDTMGWLP